MSKRDRSKVMRKNKGKDTGPEMAVRKALHALGFRYRLHNSGLPGSPDLALSKYKAVIQVHGCFWHAHECARFSWPENNAAWWHRKLVKNRERDEKNLAELNALGYRQLTVWECAMREKSEYSVDEIIEDISIWLINGQTNDSIPGTEDEKHYRENRNINST